MNKKTKVAVTVGTGVNAYTVNVLASMRDNGTGVNVELDPMQNGNANQEETALRMLQRYPDDVLKQCMRAMVMAGIEGADENVGLESTAVVPGPEVPIHKHDPRLSPDFLATILCAYRSHMLTWGDVEVFFHMAGAALPVNMSIFTSEQLKAAEGLDGDGPTADGVQPQAEPMVQ